LNNEDGEYAVAHSSKESPHLKSVQEKTEASYPMSEARMLVPSLEGAFLKFLVQISKATRVLEIGTFTGYSALWMAECLQGRGSEAKIVTLEKNEKSFKMAKENIESSELGHLIEMKLGDARETLLNFNNSVKFDLVFIDADKANYINYYNTVLERNLLSDNGFIVADNALFGGYVSQVAKGKDLSHAPDRDVKCAKLMHAFNEYVINDQRTTKILLPCFDGVMLIQKKE
ncbi:22374_t:CDS:2, partial [Racocetra persica]